MYKLIVDGSFCKDKNSGGVGGYILNESREYVAHFSHNIKSKVITQQYEAFAIIAGLNLAIEQGIKNIEVCSDEKDFIGQINDFIVNGKNFTTKLLYKKDLFEKIISLSSLFSCIKFSVHKCHHAHDLSRVYLKQKDIKKIILQLKKIKDFPEGKTSCGAVGIVPPSSKRSKRNRERKAKITLKNKNEENTHKNMFKKLLDNPEKGFFSNIPFSQHVRVIEETSNTNSYLYFNVLYNTELNAMIFVSKEHRFVFKNMTKNFITLMNHCISYIVAQFKSQSVHINLINIKRNYIHYLQSKKIIPEEYIEDFYHFSDHLHKNACTKLSYSYTNI